MTFWDGISAEIRSNLSKKDSNALNDNIRELFNRFSDVPGDEAWNLAIKVYNEHQHHYMLNIAFSGAIPANFNILPNKDEAWDILKQIPNNVDPIMKNDTISLLISQLQYRTDIIPADKAWNLLENYSNDPNPKIRGEAGFAICEYIADSSQFPKKDAWNKVKLLIKDPDKNVKERILNAFSYFYSDLPKDELWDLTLNLSKIQSKKIRDGCLNVAIEKSKDQVKLKDYLNASITLEQILKQLKNCSRIGWIRFIFLGIFFVIGIYLVKDTWIHVFNNMPYLLLGIIILMLIIWNALKLKADKYMILFYFTIFTLPILLLFPLPYVILNYIFPISPTIFNIIIFGLIPSFIIPLMIFGHTGVSIKIITKNPRYNLGEGLYNYYLGRYYVKNYIESEDSTIKLNFLKKAIKKFSKATDSYNKLLFGFENELSICPYCLNFYQGINIYEDLLRKPKDSNIKDLEKKINNSSSIMEKTSKGSDRLNKLLEELLNFTRLLIELQEKRQKFPDLDSMDRIRIDTEIKEKANDIDIIIEKIDTIISDIEDQNLPLIIEIMKEKKAELDNLSVNLKKEGYKGLDKYYSREEYNLMGILLLIVGITFLLIGGYYSSVYLVIGILFSVLGSFIMVFVKIKKTI